MKTETRKKHNKKREDIVKSLDEILASLNRIEDKLSTMIGENPKRLNEDLSIRENLRSLNEDLSRGFLAYNAAGEPVYVPYRNIATRCTNKVDELKEDFKED